MAVIPREEVIGRSESEFTACPDNKPPESGHTLIVFLCCWEHLLMLRHRAIWHHFRIVSLWACSGHWAEPKESRQCQTHSEERCEDSLSTWTRCAASPCCCQCQWVSGSIRVFLMITSVLLCSAHCSVRSGFKRVGLCVSFVVVVMLSLCRSCLHLSLSLSFSLCVF